ncbi:MAG: hypothetical protein ACI4BB_02755 [Coprococcus sp.]
MLIGWGCIPYDMLIITVDYGKKIIICLMELEKQLITVHVINCDYDAAPWLIGWNANLFYLITGDMTVRRMVGVKTAVDQCNDESV